MRQSNHYNKEQVFLDEFDRRQAVEVKFEIERVTYRNDGFAIVRTHVIENNQHLLFPQNKLVVKGQFLNPRQGDVYWGRGQLEYSREYGYSLNIRRTAEIIYPKNRADVIKYIKNNIKGLGVVRATRIVDALGVDALSILSTNPNVLNELEELKIPKAVVEEVGRSLTHGHVIDQLLTELAKLKANVDESVAFDIFERYGINSLEFLENNPYIIADINPIYWPVADKMYYDKLRSTIDESTGKLYPWKLQASFTPRIRTAVKYFLKLMLENTGSLTISLDAMRQAFSEGVPLETYGSFTDTPALKDNFLTPGVLDQHINHLVEEGTVVKTYDSKGDFYLYLKESYDSEQRLVRNVRQFITTSTPVVSTQEVNQFIQAYESRSGFTLARNQRLAVDLLVNNRISILTGGPGTGKTQTLSIIKDFVLYLEETERISNASMTFLAPTGKAAKRMEEVLEIPTSTIHRKLGLKGFNREENPRRIPEKYIIVDEFSMVDVHLASLLFNQIEDDAHILLIGDEHQLPSIGPGLVLRDLIDSGKVKTVILDEVFRQDANSQLIANANKMRDGIGYNNNKPSGLLFNQVPKGEGLGDTYFVEGDSYYLIRRRLLQLVHTLMTTHGYRLSDIMVLTAQNNGAIGRMELNALLQNQFNDEKDYLVRRSDNLLFKLGDPVIQQTNDYDYEVFNGEIGEIVALSKEGVTVDFDGEEKEYTQGNLNNIDLAYVLTIHKSQGSQSPVVIQLVDQSQNFLLNRSLVYTGYTRSEEVNILLGQYETLNQAISDTQNVQRLSLIADKI